MELQKVEILLELQKIDLDELNLVKEKIYQVSESQPGPIPWIEAKKNDTIDKSSRDFLTKMLFVLGFFT